MTPQRKTTGGGDGLSRASRQTVFAYLAVAIMLIVPLIGVAYALVDVDAPSSNAADRVITYHRGHSDLDRETYKVSYNGIASAEYNPQYWSSDNGGLTWVGPESDQKAILVVDYSDWQEDGSRVLSFSIRDGEGKILRAEDYHGGTIDLVSQNETKYSFKIRNSSHWLIAFEISYDNNKVFAGWSKTPGANVADYHPGSIIESGVSDLYAVWIEPTSWSEADYDKSLGVFRASSGNQDYTLTKPLLQFEAEYGSNYRVIYDSASEYGTIYTLSGDNTISNLSMGTYRSAGSSAASIDFSGNVVISGNVILDNLSVRGRSERNHGDGSGGLYANGNRLILGTGITAPNMTDETRYLQVFGGNTGQDLNKSTSVAIFSGVYYNVVAGSRNAIIDGSTNLVMRGGTVLDTVIGGNGGSNPGEHNYVSGSTHVYMLGNVWMPGDYYEETAMGNAFRFSSIPKITESTILTGGSNNGKVGGNTNVYVSNSAELWDVQAGGRRGSSEVIGVASAEVSGSGMVKHVLCGSITDGIDSGSARQSVKHTSLKVTGNARVGSVFGAGYDTYYSASQPSMYGEDSSISISIEGGIVGSVYGGGYRGTIGTSNEPIGSIDIRISGGTVLLDVFGGGRGGLDKVIHDDDDHYNEDRMHEASMKDTTGYSKVYANSISVRITGGEIGGSVYGGGESVPVIKSYNGLSLGEGQSGVASVVSNSVSVSLAGGTVQGSVYGAGKGVDILDVYPDGYHRTAYIFAMDRDGIYRIPWISGSGGTILQNADYGEFASLTGSVSVSIMGATINGDVYGGGQYGRTGPVSGVGDTISVVLGEAHIGGSVFAGGYGRLNELSTNSVTRTVSIDGAEIGGSVYGGSSYGNDNCHGQDNTTGYSKGSAEIRVLSGDISSGSSGNVYGGSYRGYSYMDTKILIGVPALGDGQPASDRLSIHSVYGGASVGKSNVSGYDPNLLMGSTSVLIGNMREDRTPAYRSFSIKGDVFGEGDYCGITGTSEVTFRGFNQGSALLSVQKTKFLVVEGSELDLEGNVDGSTPDASERLSLNLIGDLVLKKHGIWGASNLNLRSAASQIGGYGSLEENGTTGNVPDFSGSVQLNSIVLHKGMLMSILGTGNSGDVGSQIRGYTLIDNGGSTYYGTFVMGVTGHVLSDSTGFFVKRGDEYLATREAHYEYTLGGSELVGITMWYISGVYKVESTLVLKDSGPGSSVSSVSDEVMAPKTVKGSDILYVGGYVYADSPGSLELVENLGTDHGKFVLNLGKSGDGRLDLGENGINVTFPANGSSKFEGSGVRIGFSISTLSNFTSTGYAGTVVLHIVEMHGGILVNSFDIEIGVYLRMAETNGTIEGTIVMRTSGTPSGTTRKYSGSKDIYLPALSGNDMANYYTSLGEYVDGEWRPGSVPSGGSLSLQTVPKNLNKNGWQSSEYPDVRGEVTSSEMKGMYLGVGGVYSPVVRFHYDLQLEGDAALRPITLTVWVEEQVSRADRACYTVVLKPMIATELGLSFHDKDLIDNNGELHWSVPSVIFTIPVEFGKDVSDLYVAVSNDFLDHGINVPTNSNYCTEVRNGIDGILLYEDGSVVLGNLDEVNGRIADKAFTPKKITEFLQSYVDHKPDTEYGTGMWFDYSAYPRWYDTKDCLTLFNFETPITADTDVFAGYGIKIAIRPFTDLIDIQGSGAGISVVPSEVLVRLPGSEVRLNEIYDSLSIEPGYTKVTPDGEHGVWYTVGSNGKPTRLDDVGDNVCAFTPRADSTVYLFLEKAQYGIELYVKGGSGDGYVEYKIGDPTNPFTMTVDGGSTDVAKAVYGSEVKITFTYSGEGYRIGKVTGQTAHGIHGVGHTSDGTNHTLSFRMADGNLVIYVDMTDKRTVTVSLPDGKADNDRFSVSLEEEGGRLCIDIHDTVQGSGIHTALIQTGSEAAYLRDRNTEFGSGSFLITAYAGDRLLVCEPETSAIEYLVFSGLGDEIEIDIYVQIKWTLSISGDGYKVTRSALPDPTKPGDYILGTINATDGSSYVLTGDSLRAESTDSGRTLKSLGTSGLDMTGVDFEYRVAGSQNPSMFNPIFEFKLTVEVSFTSNGSPVEPGSWSNNTSLSLSKDSSTTKLEGRISGGVMLFPAVCSTGVYRIDVSCPGFVTYSREMTIDSPKISIGLPMIQYSVTVSSPVDSKNGTVSWNVASTDDFDSIIQSVVGDASDADMWFRSSGAGYVLRSENAPTPEMFNSENALSLLGVPSLDGTDPTSDPVPRIVVVVSEGPVNGTHSVGPVEGVEDVTLTGTVNGTEVTIRYSVDGTGASLTIDGFLDGTGAWAVNGNTLSVLIVVVPDLEGRT